VQELVRGSCSFLLLTEKGIYAGRTGGDGPRDSREKSDGLGAAMETCSFPNLGYSVERDLGPGETVLLTADGCEPRLAPRDGLQICAFLWVYYGFPPQATRDQRGVGPQPCGRFLARRHRRPSISWPGSRLGDRPRLGFAAEPGCPSGGPS